MRTRFDDGMPSHSYVGTGFATSDFREKMETSGPPCLRARVLSSASAGDACVGTSRGAGSPPAYGNGGNGELSASHDEDAHEDLYIDDERMDIEEEKTALLRKPAGALYQNEIPGLSMRAGTRYSGAIVSHALVPHRQLPRPQFYSCVNA